MRLRTHAGRGFVAEGEGEDGAGGGQADDQPFGPEEALGGPVVDEQLEVEVPGVVVDAGLGAAAQIRPVGEDRLERPAPVRAERGVEGHGHQAGSRDRAQHRPGAQVRRQRGDRAVAEPRPGDRLGQRDAHRRRGQHPRLLGGVHQPDKHTSGNGPARPAAAHVAPATGDRRKGEEDQQRLLDVVAAEVDHGRGDGREDAGQHGGRATQPVGHQHQQHDQPRAEEDRHDAVVGLGRAGEVPGPAQPQRRQREPVERRPVVLVEVVLVGAGLPEVAGLDGLVGLVGVHGAPVKLRQAHGQGTGGDGQDADGQQQRGTFHGAVSCARLAAHLAGLP